MTHVFVIGPPRSGTTLMLQAIGLHPGVASFGEELHRFHHDLGLYTHRHGEDDHFRLTARDASDAIRADYRAALATAMRHGRFSESAPVVIKISTLSLQIDYLRALFPEARFVQCVRDPRDTVCSMEDLRAALQREQSHPRLLGPAPDALSLWAAEYFEHPHLRAACSWYYHATRSYLDLRFAGADTFLRLRYEDLLVEPRRVLTDVMRFVGVDFAPEQERAVTATTDAPGHDTLGFSTSQATGPRHARYLRDLSPNALTLMTPLLRRPAQLMGYTFEAAPSEDALAHAARAIGADLDRWLERVAVETAWFETQLDVFDPIKMLREADAPLATSKPLLIDGATFGSHSDRRDGQTAIAHAWVQKQSRRYGFADPLMLWPALAQRLDGTCALEELVPPEHLRHAMELCGRLHGLGLVGYTR